MVIPRNVGCSLGHEVRSQVKARAATPLKSGTTPVFKSVAIRLSVAAGVMLAAVAGMVSAGPLEEAASAHARGDDVTAVRVLQPLAEGGNAHAQFALGFIYDTSKEISQDDVEAAKWYRKAAEQGVVGAQYNLGAMYADGHGVPQDYLEAYKWLTIAVTRSPTLDKKTHDDADKMRGAVAAKMTPWQISEGQRLAREWIPK